MTPGAEAMVRARIRPIRGRCGSRSGVARTRSRRRCGMFGRRARRPRDARLEASGLYISDQDDAGPWLRREFPTLHYIATPGDTNDYHVATWTGIAGDEFYRNGAGADFTTVSEAWVDEHMRKKGPLGEFYPRPCCIIEGDTPAFLSLMNNGFVVHESDIRRMGRPLCVAAALARDPALLDELSRLARYRRGYRRKDLYVGPGDDLALAHAFMHDSRHGWGGR